MSVDFNLPGSSFDEIQKILKGYSNVADQTSLDDLSKIVGLHKTIISRNNKFLSDIGLISGGMKKSATELGKKLGRALEHSQLQDAQKYWREAVQTNDKVSGLVTTVRIKGGMTEKDFSSHVLYVSGQKNTSGNKTGARCVVDVLMAAKLLNEEDGKLVVAAPLEAIQSDATVSEFQEETSEVNLNQVATVKSPELSSLPKSVNLTPQISINIQLHLPETENAEVYEKLFKALKENLLNSEE